MKKLKISSIVIIVTCSVLISNFAFAWNDKVTHPALTEAAVEYLRLNGWLIPYLQNNCGFTEHVKEKLPYNNKQWTILDILNEGAKEEDAWSNKSDPATARSMNHFHSPINDMGLSQGEKCIIPIIWCFQLEGESALAWAQGTGKGTGNEYSWSMARQYYSEAFLTNVAAERDASLAKTFRSLGQIIHLVQDMAVPAHTRNDSMPGHRTFKGINSIDPTMWYGNNLEIYLERNSYLAGAFGATAEIPNFNHLSSDDPATELHYFWDADVYLGDNFETAFNNDIGLAEYSSANFLSTGRMFDADGFPHPSKEDTDPIDWSNPELRRAEDNKYDQKIYYWKKNEGYRLAVAGILTKDYEDLFPEHEIWEKTTQLDENCHRDYAERLIPKAVGYSAGVLKYFFRGELEISAPDDYLYGISDNDQLTNIKVKVKNISEYNDVAETMGFGKLWAIAKYKKQNYFDPYLQDTIPGEDYDENAAYSYSVSEKKPVSAGELDKDSGVGGDDFTFDFSNNPIPINISDLYLQVVFQGELGAEPGTPSEDDGAIALSKLKDISEPAHFSFFNSTDYVFVCRGSDFYDEGECPGFLTTEQMLEQDVFPDECWNEDSRVFCNGGGEGPFIEEGRCAYPRKIDLSLFFYPERLANPSEPQAKYKELPAGRYGRVAILTDNETFAVKKTITTLSEDCPQLALDAEEVILEASVPSILPSGFCQCTDEEINSEGETICAKWTCGGCECNIENGETICAEGCEASFAEHRGIKTHKLTMPGQSEFYGLHGFLIYMPSTAGEPRLTQILDENWELYPLEDDIPFAIDSLENGD